MSISGWGSAYTIGASPQHARARQSIVPWNGMVAYTTYTYVKLDFLNIVGARKFERI